MHVIDFMMIKCCERRVGGAKHKRKRKLEREKGEKKRKLNGN